MMANLNMNSVIAGLGTFTLMQAPAADIYTVAGTLTLPGIPKGDPAVSQVVVVIKQNGSTIYTGQSGAAGFMVQTQCAINDVISMVLSSSLAEDNALNAVKTTVSVFEGE
jgi:hypothetical protein